MPGPPGGGDGGGSCATSSGVGVVGTSLTPVKSTVRFGATGPLPPIAGNVARFCAHVADVSADAVCCAAIRTARPTPAHDTVLNMLSVPLEVRWSYRIEFLSRWRRPNGPHSP